MENTTESDQRPCSIITWSHLIPKCVRIAFLLFAALFVCYGFYNTMDKVKQGNVLMKEEVQILPKLTYPSVTFCYKYRHGTKDVMKNYQIYLLDKWKRTGNFLCHTCPNLYK